MSGNKRRQYYGSQGKRPRGRGLEPGMSGFLITCTTGREKECVREAYNVLNEYVERADDGGGRAEHQHEPVEEENLSDEDVDAALARERREHQQHQHRLQQVRVDVKNLIFIRAIDQLASPERVVKCLVDEMLASGVKRTRHIMRVLPVVRACRAYVQDIEEAVGAAARAYFALGPAATDGGSGGEGDDPAKEKELGGTEGDIPVVAGPEGDAVKKENGDEKGTIPVPDAAVEDVKAKNGAESVLGDQEAVDGIGNGGAAAEPGKSAPEGTFAVAFRTRNNDMNRNEVIAAVARAFGNVVPGMRVQLSEPTYTVVVDVLASMCCISIVKDYDKYKKLNLNELSESSVASQESAGQ